MKFILENIKEIKPHIHKTHRHAWIKFLLVLLVFLGYFTFVSLKYGASQGFLVTWLTWSLFVLGTPVADAGLLIDFPIRLVLGIRMLVSEIFVWVMAISLNIMTHLFYPEVYAKTAVLRIFKYIIDSPIVLISIVSLSALGTFLSIRFGDELIDVLHHNDMEFKKKHNTKHNVLLTVFVFVIILVLYNFLLRKAGIEIGYL